MTEVKIVPYSRLNAKNKARIDEIVTGYEVKPSIVHHTTMSTHCTKFVRSMVSVSDPRREISHLLGAGKMVTTKVAVDK